MELINIRTHDGSRHFLALQLPRDWYGVRDHVERLNSAMLTGFLCDDITEAWIDFEYQRHNFTINDQFGEYWFFVSDPSCAVEILETVAEHFRSLIERPTS